MEELDARKKYKLYYSSLRFRRSCILFKMTFNISSQKVAIDELIQVKKHLHKSCDFTNSFDLYHPFFCFSWLIKRASFDSNKDALAATKMADLLSSLSVEPPTPKEKQPHRTSNKAFYKSIVIA